MENKSFYETLEDSFELLNPFEKARFMDARLEWASGGALCQEIKIRDIPLPHSQRGKDTPRPPLRGGEGKCSEGEKGLVEN